MQLKYNVWSLVSHITFNAGEGWQQESLSPLL